MHRGTTRALVGLWLCGCGGASIPEPAAPPTAPRPAPAATTVVEAREPTLGVYGVAHDLSCAMCVGSGPGLGSTGAVDPRRSAAPGRGGLAALLDDDPSTVWCADTTTPPRIELVFDAPRDVVGLELVGGDFRSAARLAAHGRVAALRLELDDRRSTVWRLADPLREPTPRPEDVVEGPRSWFEQARAWPAWFNEERDEARTTRLTLTVVETWPPGAPDVCVASLVDWIVDPREVARLEAIAP